MGVLRESLAFLKRQAWHLLLLVPGAVAVIFLHEAAHALAVIFQGGTVAEFVFIPSRHGGGFVGYHFPPGARYSNRWIALAPALACLGAVLVAGGFHLRRRPLSYCGASFVFLWLYVVPLAEIAHAAFPFLAGEDNDFRSAFGAPTLGATAAIGLLTLAACVGGYPLQARLYGEARLSAGSYAVLTGTALLLIWAVTLGLRI